MKIGIIGQELVANSMRGLARYSIGLINALGNFGLDVYVFSRGPIEEPLSKLPAKFISWNGGSEVIWEQIGVPQKSLKINLDILHAPANRGLCAFAHCPTILTRHDEIERMFPLDFPGNLRSQFRTWYSDQISLHCSSMITTVSDKSRQDILKNWNVNSKKIINLGEGIDSIFFTSTSNREIKKLLESFSINSSYILYVGGLEKRKDILTLIKAYKYVINIYPLLVIVGQLAGEVDLLKKTISILQLDKNIIFLGTLLDKQILGLYAGASCFVYPSCYEGFGLQAAEALAMGVPLIVSDGGSLPEVSGGNALQFQVGDSLGLASCLIESYEDNNGRERRISAGLNYSQKFRWSNVIGAYIDLYKSF
jgi:glycosyltransferase involved in cell wall biosynthesis